MSTQPRRVRRAELTPILGKVIEDGGDLRILFGSEHGLEVSIMSSRVMPGSGPRRHRHPHGEVLVINDGDARFEVDGEVTEAETGDMLVVPSGAWHGFTNSGTADLRITAVHDSARAVTEFEDGTIRD